MASVLSRFLMRLRDVVARDAVAHDRLILPPPRLRTGGMAFQDNAYFVRSALSEADRLIQRLGITQDTLLLDIGCGAGRLAIGLLGRLGEMRHYQGVDVKQTSVEWCRHHIGTAHPGFRFVWLDVENARYNPGGERIDQAFALPFAAGEFEVVYLYSVFSHMTSADVTRYVEEMQRVLRPGGRVFLTAFVEEDVPEESVNPPDYRSSWQGPLHCVRYERTFFENLLARHAFRVDAFEYGQETDGQSAYYLTLATLSAP